MNAHLSSSLSVTLGILVSGFCQASYGQQATWGDALTAFWNADAALTAVNEKKGAAASAETDADLAYQNAMNDFATFNIQPARSLAEEKINEGNYLKNQGGLWTTDANFSYGLGEVCAGIGMQNMTDGNAADFPEAYYWYYCAVVSFNSAIANWGEAGTQYDTAKVKFDGAWVKYQAAIAIMNP